MQALTRRWFCPEPRPSNLVTDLVEAHAGPYRGASLMRNRPTLGPYRRPMPRALGGSQGGRQFLMGEVPL